MIKFSSNAPSLLAKLMPSLGRSGEPIQIGGIRQGCFRRALCLFRRRADYSVSVDEIGAPKNGKFLTGDEAIKRLKAREESDRGASRLRSVSIKSNSGPEEPDRKFSN